MDSEVNTNTETVKMLYASINSISTQLDELKKDNANLLAMVANLLNEKSDLNEKKSRRCKGIYGSGASKGSQCTALACNGKPYCGKHGPNHWRKKNKEVALETTNSPEN